MPAIAEKPRDRIVKEEPKFVKFGAAEYLLKRDARGEFIEVEGIRVAVKDSRPTATSAQAKEIQTKRKQRSFSERIAKGIPRDGRPTLKLLDRDGRVVREIPIERRKVNLGSPKGVSERRKTAQAKEPFWKKFAKKFRRAK